MIDLAIALHLTFIDHLGHTYNSLCVDKMEIPLIMIKCYTMFLHTG